MRVYTAIIENGVVVDTEQWDDANPLAPHRTGIARTPCPDYVQTGFRHNGTDFLMPDGSAIPKSVVDADTEKTDLSDILNRLTSPGIKADVDAMKVVTGTNAERIARLEKVAVLHHRAIIKLVKSLS